MKSLALNKKLSLCGASRCMARFEGHYYDDAGALSLVFKKEGTLTLDKAMQGDFPYNMADAMMRGGGGSEEERGDKTIRKIASQIFRSTFFPKLEAALFTHSASKQMLRSLPVSVAARSSKTLPKSLSSLSRGSASMSFKSFLAARIPLSRDCGTFEEECAMQHFVLGKSPNTKGLG